LAWHSGEKSYCIKGGQSGIIDVVVGIPINASSRNAPFVWGPNASYLGINLTCRFINAFPISLLGVSGDIIKTLMEK
jgi:hypothetical protein